MRNLLNPLIDLSIYPPLIQYFIGIDWYGDKMQCCVMQESFYNEGQILVSMPNYKVINQQEFNNKVNELAKYYGGAIILDESKPFLRRK
jgi:hypothetical protein